MGVARRSGSRAGVPWYIVRTRSVEQRRATDDTLTALRASMVESLKGHLEANGIKVRVGRADPFSGVARSRPGPSERAAERASISLGRARHPGGRQAPFHKRPEAFGDGRRVDDHVQVSTAEVLENPSTFASLLGGCIIGLPEP